MHCLAILALVCSAVTVFGGVCEPDTCNPDETCCPTGVLDDYKCCPFENGVCCSDQAFCCPQGTECDIESGTCLQEDEDLERFNTLVKRQGDFQEEAFSDVCKSGSCDFDETCCPSTTPGDYSCCPYTNAVCCEGSPFCCPQDTECDTVGRTCIPKETTDNKLEKRSGPILNDEGDFKRLCEDGTLCPFDTTCCPMADGKAGCCPHLHATCCSDGIHCCPHDEACDITSQYCVGKKTVHESAVKGPALPLFSEDWE